MTDIQARYNKTDSQAAEQLDSYRHQGNWQMATQTARHQASWTGGYLDRLTDRQLQTGRQGGT